MISDASKELPGGWADAAVQEVIPFSYGKGLTKRDRDSSGVIPVYGSSGRVGVHKSALVDYATIIVGRKGSVGDVYLCRGPSYPIDTVFFSEATDELSLDFVAYQLRFLQLARLDKSTTIPSLSRDHLHKVRLRLAPRSEQSRIVEAIEEQFTRLDSGVAALKRVEANLKRYKASVLKAACEGKLTEKWRQENRDVEPASELLKRISIERRDRWEEIELARMLAKGKQPTNERWKKRYKPPAEFDPEFARFAIPLTWEWITLGCLAADVKDGPHYSPKYADSGVPFISGGNIRPEGIDFSKTKYVSRELYDELCLRCKVEKGDLLYTKGGTTGIARINTEDIEFAVWVHVAVLKIIESINPLFLQHALNSPLCYAQSQRYTHGVGNQDLGLTRMIRIALPLPPLAEQQIIVEEIDLQTSVAEDASVIVDHALNRGQRLRQSILMRAFEGKLVEQDPSDEPASVLLERIRASRDGNDSGNSQNVRSGRKRRKNSRKSA